MKPLLTALSYAKNIWPYYVGVTVASILVALTGIAIPFVISRATELMVTVVQGGEADVTGALWLAGALFGFDIANTLIRNWGGYIGDVMSAKLKAQLSTRYFEHLLVLPQSYYDSELTGTIISRLNRAINEVTNFLNVFANNFFQMILTTIITIGIIVAYSWELALLVVIIYPLFLWLTAITSKKWQKMQTAKNLEIDIASGRFAEVISQMKIVKSYVQEKLEHRHFRVRYHKTIALTRKQSKYWHDMDIIRGGVLSIVFFAIYAFIFVETVETRFTIPDMILLITLINALRTPLFSMSFIVDNFQRAITGSKDYVTAMELQPDIYDSPGAKALEVSNGVVSFNDVGFRYNEKQDVLNDITFTAESGQKVALVGESGQGKSTLSNLLMRLYEPQQGSIMIDGQDITRVTQKSLRHNIATVFQEPALFSGTIRENIAYAKPRASHEEIEQAAKVANAHDFISKLEHGYDTEIGERGIKLSGGQKQRIAIARATVKDAPILVLDEATSSLDSRAEHMVQEALDRLMRGRTTIIIAHRLSTIAHVDKIVTLKNGTVDEIGTPAELAQTDGIYGQLLELQLGTTEKAKKKLRSYDITG
ncbi:iron ABC transporter ATP-binding protein [Candidatus Saccharibacteria bacterium RIFCSPHIGHO2_01_FULL_45_15]|nr:MAG: iron ABC transporter ATP-binding protein [Candidatus Saccharibacteria bacterium RIFCSPHIGHO2_01_FULL_45_15]OGL27773.1 MAG: iron ABC transporter ATP-binding protein [Candidatus Saccharibacteria bacterium RIFCSPHIGHO2_02_FULL_46_12]OGL31661.1 MAG: iron ABC transporter ATP-binding protein [Candidatus Saccharibacteria bacterium RIFCSPHIGHO2_12_FULL_44_22]